ncbi:MAG: HAD-IA family hydrolase [Myxococcales bacterium]|nr:MAG: HAD-IA family hydrolase [Myxococcales bacterium]
MCEVSYRAVLFDLDGTLLYSIPKIIESFLHTLDTFLPDHALDEAAITARLGRPLMQQMLEISGNPDTALLMTQHYRTHNQKLIPEMQLYGGTLDALAQIRSRVKHCGIVTSKHCDSAMMSIKQHGLSQHLDTMVFAEDTTKHKPHPAPLHLACKRLGVAPEQTVYVGDAVFDLQSAKRGGLASAAALWGPNPRATLLAESPTHPLETLTDLCAFL